MNILIVGAGLSGAVIARELAEAGHDCRVIEARDHVAGNCHTRRDLETGIMLHVYGPHIFHTNNRMVWDYLHQFSQFEPYIHRVKITGQGLVYALPLNLLTLNQFFGKPMRPDQARDFLQSKAIPLTAEPQSFEDMALSLMGHDLYEAFFKGYTEKQWGRSPTTLPASLLTRLPMRFDYDDRYFAHRYQGLPRGGYTQMVKAILTHPRISLSLRTPYAPTMEADHIFWSGPIDACFDYQLGRLAYRTLDFEHFLDEGDYQGCAVMNYGDAKTPYTRITEHKHLSPWEDHRQTVCYREFSREAGPGDDPFYPVRLLRDKQLLTQYVQLAERARHVTFVGRLGTYRYLDMDVTVQEALETVAQFCACCAQGRRLGAFVHSPI